MDYDLLGLSRLYNVMQAVEVDDAGCPYYSCTSVRCVDASSSQGRLGGGEGTAGVYGSVRLAGMTTIFQAMQLQPSSRLFDAGAGMGRCV